MSRQRRLCGVKMFEIRLRGSSVTKWIQFGSAVGLAVTTICAISLMSKPFAALDARVFCSILLVSFGYLLLSRNAAEADAPWWW
jgi:hypothetical protein